MERGRLRTLHPARVQPWKAGVQYTAFPTIKALRIRARSSSGHTSQTIADCGFCSGAEPASIACRAGLILRALT